MEKTYTFVHLTFLCTPRMFKKNFKKLYLIFCRLQNHVDAVVADKLKILGWKEKTKKQTQDDVHVCSNILTHIFIKKCFFFSIFSLTNTWEHVNHIFFR